MQTERPCGSAPSGFRADISPSERANINQIRQGLAERRGPASQAAKQPDRRAARARSLWQGRRNQSCSSSAAKLARQPLGQRARHLSIPLHLPPTFGNHPFPSPSPPPSSSQSPFPFHSTNAPPFRLQPAAQAAFRAAAAADSLWRAPQVRRAHSAARCPGVWRAAAHSLRPDGRRKCAQC